MLQAPVGPLVFFLSALGAPQVVAAASLALRRAVAALATSLAVCRVHQAAVAASSAALQRRVQRAAAEASSAVPRMPLHQAAAVAAASLAVPRLTPYRVAAGAASLELQPVAAVVRQTSLVPHLLLAPADLSPLAVFKLVRLHKQTSLAVLQQVEAVAALAALPSSALGAAAQLLRVVVVPPLPSLDQPRLPASLGPAGTLEVEAARSGGRVKVAAHGKRSLFHGET